MSFSTQQLRPETMGDFEGLFSRGNGWDYCACMYFQRGGSAPGCRTRAQARDRNLDDKRALVAEGRAHGVLVYADDAPVGWCQFGPASELPLAGTAAAGPPAADEWRVTCFVTDKSHRRRGVAGLALRSALAAIGDAGGGFVEGYPVVQGRADAEFRRLVRLHGRDSDRVTSHLARHGPPTVTVDGVGEVPVARGSFGYNSTQGTVSTFQHHGFDAVGLLSGGIRQAGMALSPPQAVHVRMRRHVPATSA